MIQSKLILLAIIYGQTLFLVTDFQLCTPKYELYCCPKINTLLIYIYVILSINSTEALLLSPESFFDLITKVWVF